MKEEFDWFDFSDLDDNVEVKHCTSEEFEKSLNEEFENLKKQGIEVIDK